MPLLVAKVAQKPPQGIYGGSAEVKSKTNAPGGQSICRLRFLTIFTSALVTTAQGSRLSAADAIAGSKVRYAQDLLLFVFPKAPQKVHGLQKCNP
jgi:hypothetical protein